MTLSSASSFANDVVPKDFADEHIRYECFIWAESATTQRDKAIAKELREIMIVALNTPHCHKTEQELRDCLGVLIARCDTLAEQLDGEKVTK